MIFVPSFHPAFTSTVRILSLILDVQPSWFITCGTHQLWVTGPRVRSEKCCSLKCVSSNPAGDFDLFGASVEQVIQGQVEVSLNVRVLVLCHSGL